jgi:hypothetical protein
MMGTSKCSRNGNGTSDACRKANCPQVVNLPRAILPHLSKTGSCPTYTKGLVVVLASFVFISAAVFDVLFATELTANLLHIAAPL